MNFHELKPMLITRLPREYTDDIWEIATKDQNGVYHLHSGPVFHTPEQATRFACESYDREDRYSDILDQLNKLETGGALEIDPHVNTIHLTFHTGSQKSFFDKSREGTFDVMFPPIKEADEPCERCGCNQRQRAFTSDCPAAMVFYICANEHCPSIQRLKPGWDKKGKSQ